MRRLNDKQAVALRAMVAVRDKGFCSGAVARSSNAGSSPAGIPHPDDGTYVTVTAGTVKALEARGLVTLDWSREVQHSSNSPRYGPQSVRVWSIWKATVTDLGREVAATYEKAAAV